jgi:hypothetical protein
MNYGIMIGIELTILMEYFETHQCGESTENGIFIEYGILYNGILITRY